MVEKSILVHKPKYFKPAAKVSIFIFLAIVLIGCAHFISYYDTISYKNLTDLKAETLLLIDSINESTNPANYTDKLSGLKLDIEKAYQYEKGKKLNDDTIAQLGEIKDMINGMVSLLKEQGSLSPTYLKEKRRQFETAFDLAIDTEGSKIRRKGY